MNAKLSAALGISVAAITLLSLGSVASAQQPATPALAPSSAAPDAALLPGDAAPPPLSGMLSPSKPGPEAPVDATPALPLALAEEAAMAALDFCSAHGHRIAVAVVNSAGKMQVGLAADGTDAERVYVSARKGITALAFQTPTSEAQRRLRAGDQAAYALLKSNMEVWPGAVPILRGRDVIGAIGTSGASSEQDEECAAAGLEKIKAKLE